PAGLAEIASAARRVGLADGGGILFLPGLTDRSARPFPDVMRGEETQLVGLGLETDRTRILPGTPCQSGPLRTGRIRPFRRSVPGGVYSSLLRPSFIARMAKPSEEPDWAAFGEGLAAARDEAAASGLLSRLFSVRTGWLAGKLLSEEASDYLSGLMLGCELG